MTHGARMSDFEPTEISNGVRVAWVTQGIVLFVAADLSSIWPAWLSAWDELLRTPIASGFHFARRWDLPAWQPWDATYAPHLRGELERRGPAWNYWKVELAERPEFPELSLDFQNLPQTAGQYPRASYIRVRMPMRAHPEDLFEWTRLLCAALPVQQGVAGYLCSVAEASRAVGFDQAWAWARRYYGVHVFDPVEHTWDAPHGLLGVNWLTLLGNAWLQPDAALAGVDLDHVAAPLSVTRTPHAAIVRAGNRPLLGDQNRFEDLSAYTLASRLVEPALIQEPAHLPGMFRDHESTPKWIRRFLDPTAWQNSG